MPRIIAVANRQRTCCRRIYRQLRCFLRHCPFRGDHRHPNRVLVNRQTNFYPKQYSILLDTINVRNIIARDDGGTVTPAITQKDGKTEILLTFNKQIVGIDKQTEFTLRFENLDIAQKNGNIWEVNIPGITDDEDLGTYSVSIQTPPTFGATSYLKPRPADGKRWNRDQMTQGGISAAYGNTQFAKLTLRYYLDNPGVRVTRQEIALPPRYGISTGCHRYDKP